jgi:hypothetical protein
LRYFYWHEVAAGVIRVVSSGDEVIVAGAGPGGGRVHLLSSRDRGGTWSEPVTVGPRSDGWWGPYIYPEIAIDGSGTWHVAGATNLATWKGFDLLHRESIDRGVTWSDPDTLNAGPRGVDYSDNDHAFRIRADGEVVTVAYTDVPFPEDPEERWAIHVASLRPAVHEPELERLRVVPRHNPLLRTEVAELLVFLPVAATLRSAVFNVFGREILSWTVPDAGSGETTLRWDGRDQRGRRVGAGVYFWRVEAGGRLGSRTVRQVLY